MHADSLYEREKQSNTSLFLAGFAVLRSENPMTEALKPLQAHLREEFDISKSFTSLLALG